MFLYVSDVVLLVVGIAGEICRDNVAAGVPPANQCDCYVDLFGYCFDVALDVVSAA